MNFLFILGFFFIEQGSLLTTESDTIAFSGEVQRGQTYSYTFNDSLTFELIPTDDGWEISIHTAARSKENIARLTPPFHFAPNPRFIEGWNFRNASNTGPNDGSVNAPTEVREFFFSPKVGVKINYPMSNEELQQIERDGRGTLTITQLELGNLVPNKLAYIEKMQFCVILYFSH